MKLHRIELCNLNSLYGTQVVDLDDTLGGASLFLIHGPTGAGKSTLMDAVSLALFGQTPRLSGRGDGDPRNIMSHDTGECMAEVVFSKLESDGRHHYRARWRARRARKQPTGKFQDPDRSLERRSADGSWKTLVSSRKVKDFAPAFDEVLEGFTVEDFKRSMLLAQGQFDALLDATPDARASILERLTDTSEYKRLGARAARVRSAHERKIKTLGAKLEGTEPVDAETFERLGGRVETLTTKVTAARAKVGDLELAIRQRANHDELEADVARRTRAITDLDLAQKTAAQVHETALAATKIRETEDDAARERAALLGPLLDTAGRASDQLAAAHEQYTTAQGRVAAARDQLARTRSELDDRNEAHQRAQVAAQRARDARDADPRLVRLAARARELERALDRLAQTVRDADETSQRLRSEEASLASRERSTDAQARDLAEARSERLAPLEAALAAIRDQLDTARGDLEPAEHMASLKQSAREATSRSAALSELQRAVETSAQARTSKERAELRCQSVGEELESARQELAKRAELAEASQARLESQTRAHERLTKVASLAGHRASLVDGEPCPLCGSTAHPLANIEVDETVAESLAALEAAREGHDVAVQGRMGAASLVETLAERQRLASSDLAAAVTKFEAADNEVQRSSTSPEVALPLPDDPEQALAGVLEAVAHQRALVERTQSQLDAFERLWAEMHGAERKVLECERALDDRRTELERARGGIEQARAKLEREQADLDELLLALASDATSLHARLVEFGLAVAPPAPPAPPPVETWLAELHAAERAQIARIEAVEKAEKHAAQTEAARAELSARVETLSQGLEERIAEAKTAETGLAAANTADQAALSALHDAWGHRATETGVPSPPTPAEMAERLAESIEKTARARTQAQQAQLEASNALAEARTRAHAAKTQLAEVANAVQAAKQELQSIEARYGSAEREPLLEALATIKRELEALESEFQQAHGELQVAKDQRARADRFGDQLERARTEAAPWLTLHELIGKNDGDAFKQFAQALNLARLLDRANVHLARLSERYRLAQVLDEGTPTLEFAVEDLFALGRLRSPRGLSGGERFLVSLALALGLSDLRTVNMPIDTLLLDEGFGTLDPETLSVAIGALSQLQASGRQVGIISHVVGLKERIDAQVVVQPTGDGRSRVSIPRF